MKFNSKNSFRSLDNISSSGKTIQYKEHIHKSIGDSSNQLSINTTLSFLFLVPNALPQIIAHLPLLIKPYKCLLIDASKLGWSVLSFDINISKSYPFEQDIKRTNTNILFLNQMKNLQEKSS